MFKKQVMQTNDFTTTLSVDKTPMEIFDAINDIGAWWNTGVQGNSKILNHEFEVRFADMHYSRQKLIELIPGKKIVWLVTDSQLNFLTDKSEWTGTTIHFDIEEADGKSNIIFTHQGLLPAIECFKDCSNGWNHYLHGSLFPLLAEGEGKPYKPKIEV